MFDTIKSKREVILKIYTIILIVATIIFSRNTLITTCILGFNKTFLILTILYLPTFVMYLIKIIKKEIELNRFLPVIIMIGAILASVFIKGDWQLYNFSIIYYIVATIIFETVLIDFKSFSKYYINIMLVLSILSLLVTYVAKPFIFSHNLMAQVEESNLVITNSVNNKFLNLGFGFAMLIEDYDRNFGIFTEPNFYQFYLIIAIVLLLFTRDRKKLIEWGKLAILALTVYSTQSTTGIFMLIGVGAVIVLNSILKDKKNIKKLSLTIGTSVIVAILIVSMPPVQEKISRAYQKVTTVNDSSKSRFGSMEYALTKFVASPVIGDKISEILLYENDLTNTTLTIGAIYGIIPCIWLIYCNWKFAKQFKQKKLITICILFLTMLAYNSHFFLGVQSFWMILLLGFSNTGEEVVDENTLES